MTVTVLTGDCLDVLKTLPDESVHCCVTSPPYWGLRDYGHAGQIGLEPTPEEFVLALVEVFSEVRRVLRGDGTAWVNMGDTYARDPGKGDRADYLGLHKNLADSGCRHASQKRTMAGLKPKDLIGVPWRLAFALQADGWYLRSDIIWSKPNPMPESVTDRPTKAHEYIFLLTKSERYYYDAEAIYEPFAPATTPRAMRAQESDARADGVPGQPPHALHAPRSYKGSSFTKGKTAAVKPTVGQGERVEAEGRNKRTVWTVSTQPFKQAHFATFPPDLIEPCIKAGCPVGGTVLDPFGGAGTTGLVADRLQRDAILIELNPEYAQMARERIVNDSPLFASVQ